jgi:ABC-type transporter Mla subunit MlaD
VSFVENRGLWFGAAGLALSLALIIWLLAGSQPLRLVILFDDVGGLKKEDPVLWKGLEIGKVEEIRPLVENKIGVTIKIPEDHVSTISHGSEFALKRSKLLGLVGQDAIEVTIPRTPGAPFSSGEKVYGISTPQASLLKDGKEIGLQYWNQIKEEATRFFEEVRNSPYRDDLAEAAGRLKKLASEGARQTAEEVGRFSREHRKELESLVQEMKRLKEKLLKTGDQPGARRMEKQIEKLEESLQP